MGLSKMEPQFQWDFFEELEEIAQTYGSLISLEVFVCLPISLFYCSIEMLTKRYIQEIFGYQNMGKILTPSSKIVYVMFRK